ncbi:MAG: hypothetical protein HFJ09_05920 [Lachnospiraceae bacterium]|nr:hypothetical protein [Lachnospiraceae bacterium]
MGLNVTIHGSEQLRVIDKNKTWFVLAQRPSFILIVEPNVYEQERATA